MADETGILSELPSYKAFEAECIASLCEERKIATRIKLTPSGRARIPCAQTNGSPHWTR